MYEPGNKKLFNIPDSSPKTLSETRGGLMSMHNNTNSLADGWNRTQFIKTKKRILNTNTNNN